MSILEQRKKSPNVATTALVMPSPRSALSELSSSEEPRPAALILLLTALFLSVAGWAVRARPGQWPVASL